MVLPDAYILTSFPYSMHIYCTSLADAYIYSNPSLADAYMSMTSPCRMLHITID